MTITAAPRKSLEPFLKDAVEYYPHQTEGVRWCIKKPSFILADDMGLGKSLQGLTVFAIDVKIGRAETCIIVAPTTLRDNWAEEITKFTRIPFLLFGQEAHPSRPGKMRKLSPTKRAEQLEEWMFGQIGPRILITNYEQLISPETEPLFRKFHFDVAIFDEAHYIKNPTAKRSKASLGIQSSRSFMLTGTPMLNQVNELWSLLHRVDPRRFPDYWKFVNRYCVFGGYENREIVGTKNNNELTKILGEYMIRRLKKNVLKRDEPTYQQIYVGLTPRQQELYDSVLEDLLLPGVGNEAEDVFIENHLTKFLRLKQICGTPSAIDPSYPDDSMKLDRAVEIIQEFTERGEKIGVFTQFREVQDALNRRLQRANRKLPIFSLHGGIPAASRQPTVHEWSAVKGPAVMNCMIQVAGVGLNMVAASTVLFLDKLFVPGLNKQAVDRFDRIGQTEPVQVIELITRNTVEQRVEEILAEKTATSEIIIEGGVNMGTLLKKLTERLKAAA